AIAILEAMKTELPWRGDVTTVLARAYLDEQRYDDAIHLLERSTYSNWEGDIDNWLVFVSAHIERGRLRLDAGDPRDAAAALQDFDAALTYPENVHVGRPSRPREARARYWRGSALAALGRDDEAREAWTAGAENAPLDDEQKEFIAKCQVQLGKRR
ncbi:MAG: tetratricopeptide repeat protein, partial [Vicinamibacterales bacterium]|nr:tetratricopeptide repeat protein [Vicinamibacterales bacterium]